MSKEEALMDTTDPMDRLTILERAQLLHDATLRRHGEMLDRHEDSRLQYEAQMARMETLTEQQQRLQADLREIATRLAQRQDFHEEIMQHLVQRQDQHEEMMQRLAQTLQAIKDLLDRLNGH
jgi:DNA repair exonuclease SbcCD ATPase subunit